MGTKFFDKYSFLHLAVGVIFNYWNISLINSVIIHIIFEYLENTKQGMFIINKFSRWPGGKTYADSFINNIGDNVFS